MPRYQYTVRDETGAAESGLLAADSPDQLRRTLRTNHLYLVSYKEVGESVRATEDEPKAVRTIRASVTSTDLIILLKQLSTFVNAGLSMDTGLDTLAAQTRNKDLKAALIDIRSQVLQGSSLTAALRRHGAIFDNITIALVEAGEGTGMLPDTLRTAAEQVERRHRIMRTIKSATLYPKIVVGVVVATVVAMLLLVVPSFQSVYKQLHTDLPPQTQFLINLSAFLQERWWAVVLVVAGISIAAQRYTSTGPGRRQFDLMVLRLPYFGELIRKIALTRFVQTLLASVRGGVPLLRAMSLAGGTVGNTVIRAAAMDAAVGVRGGGRIGKELERTGEFPLLMTRMISAGEASGELERMLDEINKLYEEDVDETVGRVGKIIEPVLAIMVGGIVLFVMLALYLPIFNLAKAIRKA